MKLVNGKIKILNYEKVAQGFPTDSNPRGFFIEASRDGINPVVGYVLYSDIVQENSRSDVFRNGNYSFDEADVNEVYKDLNIDKNEVYTVARIKSSLFDKSAENLKRIYDINSLSLATRFKRWLIDTMTNSGETVPHQIVTAIEEVYKALLYNKRIESKSLESLKADERKRNEERQSQSQISDLTDKLSEATQLLQSLKTEKENSEKQTQGALADLLQMVQALKSENDSLKKSASDNVEPKSTKKKSANTEKVE